MQIKKIIFAVICVLLSISFAAAQSQLGTGSINGTVEDANSSSVNGATVTILNEETNLKRSVNTNNDGQFSVPVLPVGNYKIRVELQGFSTLEQNNINVTVGRTVTVRLALQPGELSAVVTVENSPQIDTTKTDESFLINREQINDLPINGRRADQFALLTPGVTRDGRFGLLSYHGQSSVFNNFTLEGNDDNQAYFSEARGRTRIASNISANAVQEFQVSQSNFLPEFGRSAGGGINATVRSGGNQFHGDGFWYFRNKSLNARDPLATINPDERRDQFGGSVNGPIIKDKLFYFVNYDQQIRNFPLITQDLSNVLTNNDPGPLPANPTAAQTANFNAFARGVADLRSRFPGGSPGNTLSRKFDQNLFLTKIDWIVNNANSVSFTYNYLNARNLNGIQTPIVLGNVGRNGSDDVRINSSNLRVTSTLSSSLINEFRYQNSRDFEFEFGNEPPPQVFVGGFSYGRATFLERPALPDERRNQFIDNLTYTVGNHSLKFGGEINHVTDNIDNPANFGGSYSYANALLYGCDLVANSGCANARNYSTNGYQQSFGIPGLKFSTTDFAAFAQDQWRVNRRLTLNYGLRYDYQLLPDPVAPNPDVPETTRINEAKKNFGPRIGGAYDIFGNGKTVIRAGIGLYYGRTPNGTIFNALTQTGLTNPDGSPALDRTVVSIRLSPTSPGAPTFPNVFTSFPTGTGASLTVFRLSPDYENPRLTEFNVGIEREIVKNLVVSGTFLYTKGSRLPVNFDSNLPEPQFTRTYQTPDGATFTVPFAAGVTCTIVAASCPTANRVNINSSRPNPAFGSLNVLTSIGETFYKALLVEVKRRFASGLQFNIAYTLAKAENTSGTGGGDGSSAESPFGGGSLLNQFDSNLSRGIAPTDQRNRLVINGVYQFPKIKNGSGFARALLNGFQLSGIYTAESGRPYSANLSLPQLSFSDNGQTYSPFGGGTLGLGGLSIAPNIPRNSISGDANYRLDLRLSRTFKIRERVSIELLAEGFNVFNRANFNGFNTTFYNTITPSPNPPTLATPIVFLTPVNSSGVPTFGTPNNDGSQPDGTNARRFQLAARFRF